MKLLDCLPVTPLTVLSFYCLAFVKHIAGMSNTGTHTELFKISRLPGPCHLTDQFFLPHEKQQRLFQFSILYHSSHSTINSLLNAYPLSIKIRLHTICTSFMAYNLHFTVFIQPQLDFP